MAKLLIDLSGMKGLAPRYDGDFPFAGSQPELRIVGKDGQYADGIVNPMSMLGYMSPASDTTVNTTHAGISPLAMVCAFQERADNDEMFAAIYQEGSTTASEILKLTSYTDKVWETFLTIEGQGGVDYPILTDMVRYPVNNSQKLLYTWRSKDAPQNTSNMGMSDMISSQDDDFLSTLASGGATLDGHDHRLIVADNQMLYIIDAWSIHKFDGTVTGGANGTATMNVLDFLGASTTLGQPIDAIDFRGAMWIAVHPLGPHKYDDNVVNLTDLSQKMFSNPTAGVYIWDRRTTEIGFQDYIPIAGVKELWAIYNFKGNPLVIATGSNDLTQIRVWNGAEFALKKELGNKAFPRFHKSGFETDLGLWWLGSDGILYFYGALAEGLDDGLYKMGDMSGHTTDSGTIDKTGAIIPWGGATTVASSDKSHTTTPLSFLVSYEDDSSDEHIKYWFPHAHSFDSNNHKAYTGEVFSMVKLLPKLSNLRGVTINFPAIGSGGSTELLTIKIYINQSSTASKTKVLTKNDLQNGFVWISFGKKNVNAIQIGLAWKAENIANNITPYVAIVDYEPVDKKK